MKLAAVFVGILILTTVASAYWVYTNARSPPPVSPPFKYAQFRNGTFVAQVLPSALYNSTTVTGGNTTLFTALTRSIDVSYSYTVVASRPESLALTEETLVWIQTPAWSKLVSGFTNETSFPEATRFVLAGSVSLNFTNLSAVQSQIVNETKVGAPNWEIAIIPSFVASLSTPGVTNVIALADPIWFNVSAGAITPGGLVASQAGSGPSNGPDGTSGRASWMVWLSYGVLAASAASLAAAAYWLARSDRLTPERELDRLTQPYSEVIVGTRTRPHPGETIRLSRWEDLVKVADTTGRPILRIEGAGGLEKGSVFFVLDGTIGYVYVYYKGPELDAASGSHRGISPGEEGSKSRSTTSDGVGRPPVRSTGAQPESKSQQRGKS